MASLVLAAIGRGDRDCGFLKRGKIAWMLAVGQGKNMTVLRACCESLMMF